MNRLALASCIVVAFYVALASYIAWPIVVYELGQPRARSNIPMNFPNRAIRGDDNSSPSSQTNAAAPSYETPKKPVGNTEGPAAAVWVIVLLPAKVHTGPSVDTPISHFYPVGTPLHATRYRNDWFEITEPGTSKTGWIYRKYLGAIDDSEQSKIASQEAQAQSALAEMAIPGKRYAKAIPIRITPKPFALRRDQLASSLSRLSPSAAEPKWLACCSVH
jgi:hypothetical protein